MQFRQGRHFPHGSRFRHGASSGGFGHRVYKNYDPRAGIIKRAAEAVFEVTGRNPKLDIAIELERIALSDEYFIKRKLYPNVDFYSGIIYQAMGFKPEMFTVMFAIPRTAGWPSGKNCCRIRSRKLRGLARSIPVTWCGMWCRSSRDPHRPRASPQPDKGRGLFFAVFVAFAVCF